MTGACGHWYVAQTKPHQERNVLDRLLVRAAGTETFCPRIEVTRRRGGRRAVMLEPLFPSYLFVRINGEPPAWSAIMWTPGLRGVLGDGERPVPVPDEFIASVQERVAPLGFIRLEVQFQPGASVRVREGPFAGLDGIFERRTSREGRVRVLLEMLGRHAPIELDDLYLERR